MVPGARECPLRNQMDYTMRKKRNELLLGAQAPVIDYQSSLVVVSSFGQGKHIKEAVETIVVKKYMCMGSSFSSGSCKGGWAPQSEVWTKE